MSLNTYKQFLQLYKLTSTGLHGLPLLSMLAHLVTLEPCLSFSFLFAEPLKEVEHACKNLLVFFHIRD